MRRQALVLVAAAEWAGVAWADVNGRGYDWWRDVLIVLACSSLALLVLPAPRLPRWWAPPGIVVALAAVVVTTQHFDDSYRGSDAWSDLLAVAFFAGVLVAELALLSRRASARSSRASA
jgi:hypothetical protein